jgi:hypothetical protein
MLQIDVAQTIAESWNIFTSGNIVEAYRTISSAAYWESTDPPLAKIREIELKKITFLLSYDYPEVKDIKEESKREFAQIVAWNHLLDSSISKDHIWWFKKAYIAPFLGNTYSLDININNMIITTDIFLPDYTEDKLLKTIFDSHRYQSWPELQNLQNLSVTTRSIFVNVLRYAQIRFGGLADIKRITLPDLTESKQALRQLSLVKLIESNPSTSDFLMSKNLLDLKQFAAKHEIDSSGTKGQLIKNFISGVNTQLLKEWLTDTDPAVYIKLIVSNFPLLKKYVLTESTLLETYGSWVYQTQFLKKSNNLIRLERHEKLQSNPYKPMEPWKPSLLSNTHIRILNNPKIELLRKIWDDSCDLILKEIIEKYAWDWEDHLVKSLHDQLLPEKLHAMDEVLNDNLNLYRICERRVTELNLKIRQPSLLVCEGCGIQFMDWSVNPRTAENVGYKIHFCQHCYTIAFARFTFGIGKPLLEIENKELALNQLLQVATILKIVPNNHFLRGRSLAGISNEDQISLVKTLIDMPPYKLYIKAFGSWLNALILSEVLTGGTRRTSRGIQCIALDGHKCLSLVEKTIDDWFTEHNISHEKEPAYPYHPHLNPSKMRADWKVQNILIEYAGLMDEPDYASKINAKVELSRESNLTLIILYPGDILNLEIKLEKLLMFGK